ncbi:hypothetical protein [Pelagibacterium sp.]|uniref:hypothetical protein n=1 Tax=Pelagibacterium sp. TaxID=1967288 RepID=UPI003A945009
MAETDEQLEDLSYRHAFKDAYAINLDLLHFVAEQVQPFAEKPLAFEVRLSGGFSFKKADVASLEKIPLIETSLIESVSVSSDSMSLPIFSLSISSKYGPGEMSMAGSLSPLKLETLASRIKGRVQSLRPWYWPIYRGWFEFALMVAVLTVGPFLAQALFPNTDPNVRVIVVSVPMLAIPLALRWLLFRRVEFLVGLSGRRAKARSFWRKIVGTVILIPSVLAIFWSYLLQ